MHRRALLAGAAALATTVGPTFAATPAEVAANSRALNAFLDAAYERDLLEDPENLTSLGRKERYDSLTDRTEAYGERRLAARRRSVAQMKRRFDPALLDEEARTSFDVWAHELERAEISNRWRRHRFVFPRGGPHVGLPNFLINQHRVESRADMAAYIARVRRIPTAFDQLLVRARAASAQGVRMPRFSYDLAIDEIGRLLAGAPFAGGPDSALLADGKAKIAALKAAGKVDEVQAEALRRDLVAAMTGPMKAGYDRVSAWLRTDREAAPAEARGAGALPDGAAYYDASLYLQTTTRMTAEEIHALGLAEVARIHAEMEAVKVRTGFTGPLADFFGLMRTDPRFYLPNTDGGRAQYLKLAEGYLAAVSQKLPQYFGRLPKAPLVVRRVEAFREEPGGAAHYFTPALDGSRPGIFYAHLSDMSAAATFTLEALACHEGVPGHHMQLSIAQETTGLATFRTRLGYTAYIEGWGLYAEALAKEMGFYTDPYNDFGRLGSELWRAVRLVVDTGLHAKGWSEDRAVRYALANSPRPEVGVRSEVRRYLLNPGQATSYKIGMLRIQAIRDQARRTLGPRFDYRAFHDQVLAGGALPLPVLEARLARWAQGLAA